MLALHNFIIFTIHFVPYIPKSAVSFPDNRSSTTIIAVSIMVRILINTKIIQGLPLTFELVRYLFVGFPSETKPTGLTIPYSVPPVDCYN